MSFNQHNKASKQYSIQFKSKNGNIVGFLNLTNQFVKAVVGKSEETTTVADVLNIDGNFEDYIKSLVIEVVPTEHHESGKVKASDF